jgi:SAM-dependent methyltransferase
MRAKGEPANVYKTSLFGVVAPTLGWAPPLRYLLRRARILDVLKATPCGALLEVGCGSGALLDDLATLGHRVTGLESSTAALRMASAIATATGGGQEVVGASQANWVGAHDFVCAFDVLEHIEDDGAAIDLWRSWLKPGGSLLISVPAHRNRWGAGDVWAGHWRRYDQADLLGLLRAHDLRIKHVECYGFPLANLTEWLGQRGYRRMLSRQGAALSKADASASSGIDRGAYLRLFRYLDTGVGRMLLRLCLLMQRLAIRTNLGSGYLVVAERP